VSLDITPAVAAGTQLVQAYGNGGFRIANEAHSGSILVFQQSTAPLAADHVDALNGDVLAPVIEAAAEIDILVVGCGERFSTPSESLRGLLRPHGIVMEWMDTGAACRTFNVLMTEGRRAAAALIAVANEIG